MRLLLLAGENSDLHDQLSRKDQQVKTLSGQCGKLRAELACFPKDGRNQHRTQERELDCLKVRFQPDNTRHPPQRIHSTNASTAERTSIHEQIGRGFKKATYG